MFTALILKLKQLYFDRKTNGPKGKQKRMNKPVQKKYLIGLHEVMKHVKMGELKLVVVATDIEKVDVERGTDDVLNELILTCRKQEVPVLFAFNRYRLGCLTKFKGQRVSCVGIRSFQGANELFNRLLALG